MNTGWLATALLLASIKFPDTVFVAAKVAEDSVKRKIIIRVKVFFIQ
jgi:hypothetical protein